MARGPRTVTNGQALVFPEESGAAAVAIVLPIGKAVPGFHQGDQLASRGAGVVGLPSPDRSSASCDRASG